MEMSAKLCCLELLTRKKLFVISNLKKIPIFHDKYQRMQQDPAEHLYEWMKALGPFIGKDLLASFRQEIIEIETCPRGCLKGSKKIPNPGLVLTLAVEKSPDSLTEILRRRFLTFRVVDRPHGCRSRKVFEKFQIKRISKDLLISLQRAPKDPTSTMKNMAQCEIPPYIDMDPYHRKLRTLFLWKPKVLLFDR